MLVQRGTLSFSQSGSSGQQISKSVTLSTAVNASKSFVIIDTFAGSAYDSIVGESYIEGFNGTTLTIKAYIGASVSWQVITFA